MGDNNNSKYKILFFIPSPRNIPEVKKPIVDLLYKKHDVIWYKYHREIEAYEKAQDFFLNSKEKYDYLCIIPDDLVINQAGIENLFNELENPSIDVPFYKILAGVCNLSFLNQQHMDKAAASSVMLPVSDNSQGVLVWDYMIKFKDLYAREENILQCMFIGFSCYFIHRSVLEDISFRGNPIQDGIDKLFAEDLEDAAIKQYIDKRSRFVHLRGLSSQTINSVSVNPDILLVGKIKPHVIFVPREQSTHKPFPQAEAIPIPTKFEPATTFSGPYKGPPAKAEYLAVEVNGTGMSVSGVNEKYPTKRNKRRHKSK